MNDFKNINFHMSVCYVADMALTIGLGGEEGEQ